MCKSTVDSSTFDCQCDKAGTSVGSPRVPVQCCYGPAKAELIRIAACLLKLVPSDLIDDYPQKTYSASRVAGMMVKPNETAKILAYQLRRIADSLEV
jgi:hypothetical protein